MMMQTAEIDPRSPYLGISANYPHTIEPKKPTRSNGKMQATLVRYKLQRTAQSLLWNSEATKQHRVCSCHRNVASDGVTIYRTVSQDNARIGNVISCGSVWACPICNSKVTQQRQVDMQKAIVTWAKDGGTCLLLTRTFPHEADMPLPELLGKFSAASDDYKKDRTYQRIFGTSEAAIQKAIQRGKPPKTIKQGEFPRLGSVVSQEVTYGENGWHPHTHEVLFMDSADLLKCQRAIDELKALWVRCCLKNGLGDNSKLQDMLAHGLDIRGGDYVAEYVNKFGREPELFKGWTIAHEVTKANSKTGMRMIGKEYHATPFMLLRWATEGDETAAQKFKEFAAAFEGKRMNHWSTGLKDYLGINEMTDEEIAADDAQKPQEEFVYRVPVEDWRNVLATNSRGELLTVAREFGEQGVIRLLEELKTRPKSYRGWFLDEARPDVSRFFR